jgi:DNA-binding response OmpR family regulator
MKIGVICIFSEDSNLLYEQTARLSDKGYLVFSTANVYKFVRYAQELQPDLIVFDMDAKAIQDERVVAYLQRYQYQSHKPVLMLGKHFDRCYQGVAHYEQKPYTLKDFDDIIDSYCKGNRQHDVLLIDDCVHKDDKIRDTILGQNLSCFEVSDADAARYYLQKNHPRCICLNMPYDKCAKIESKIGHDKVFFVDNYKQVKNLARLI